MREIKFRGFYHTEKNALYPEVKKWIYGSLEIRDRDSYWITDIEDISKKYRVDPETVGQYIGIKAKGVEIYEGDIFEYKGQRLIVRQDGGAFVGHYHGSNEFIFINDFWDIEDKFVILGNKVNNSELLKE